jgi:hypothetical protein
MTDREEQPEQNRNAETGMAGWDNKSVTAGNMTERTVRMWTKIGHLNRTGYSR